jgi:hypothetical protein
MIDTNDFGRRFADRLFDISAENQGISRIEVVRRYHTDSKYKGMVDAIVWAATTVIQSIEQDGWDPLGSLQETFQHEVSGLLDIDAPGSEH